MSKALLSVMVALVAAACVNKGNSQVAQQNRPAEAVTQDATQVSAASPQVDQKPSHATVVSKTKKPVRQLKVAKKTTQQEATQQMDPVRAGIHKDGPG